MPVNSAENGTEATDLNTASYSDTALTMVPACNDSLSRSPVETSSSTNMSDNSHHHIVL